MLNRALTLLKPAPVAARIRDQAEINARYRYWRFRILYSSLIGYALFYFVRKNLSLAMPVMEQDLGISKADLGIFLTLHGICYGVSKFANGFLGDRTNPRYFMALGLILSALMNVCFGLSSAVTALGIFWLLNGWFQGMGFPPCARSLTQWFDAQERGTRFAIWNTSHSIGAAAALLVCSRLVFLDWRLCFLVPALLATLGAVFLIERMRDTPESLGLPSIEEYRGEAEASEVNAASPGAPGDSLETGQREALPPEGEFRQFVIQQVLLNPMIWVISVANFFVYTVRAAILDWGPTFLTETKHVELHHAGWIVAGYEVAGVFGMLVSGWMTDKLFRGRGGRACFFYMLLCAACIYLFWRLPGQSVFVNTALLCAIGFFIYGPQCLVGVIAANLATKRAAATAIGVTGLFGYLSGILSGWGLGRIVQSGGWDPGLGTILASAGVATVLFALSWNDRHPTLRQPRAFPVLELEAKQ